MDGEITTEDLEHELVENWSYPVLLEVAAHLGIQVDDPDIAHEDLARKIVTNSDFDTLLEALMTHEPTSTEAAAPAEGKAVDMSEGDEVHEVLARPTEPPVRDDEDPEEAAAALAAAEALSQVEEESRIAEANAAAASLVAEEEASSAEGSHAPSEGVPDAEEIPEDALVEELRSNWTHDEILEMCRSFGVLVNDDDPTVDNIRALVRAVPQSALIEDLLSRESRREASSVRSAPPEEVAASAEPEVAPEPEPEPEPEAEPEASSAVGEESRAAGYDDSNLLKELRSMRRDSEFGDEELDEEDKEEPEGGVGAFLAVTVGVFAVFFMVNPTFRARVQRMIGAQPPTATAPPTTSVDPTGSTTGTAATSGTLVTTGGDTEGELPTGGEVLATPTALDPSATATPSPPPTEPSPLATSTSAPEVPTSPPEGTATTPPPSAPGVAEATPPATVAVTPTPSPTSEEAPPPSATTAPEATSAPAVTSVPAVTTAPEATSAPEATTSPGLTTPPEATASAEQPPAPEATSTPEATSSPEVSPPSVLQPTSDGAPQGEALARALASQAEDARRSNDLKRAVAKFEQALREGGEGWSQADAVTALVRDLGTQLAQQSFDSGEVSRALSELRRVSRHGDFSETWLLTGRCYERLGAYADAVGAYRRAVRADPENGRAHYYLAYACRAQKLFDEAERHADLAEKHGFKLDPGFRILLRLRPVDGR